MPESKKLRKFNKRFTNRIFGLLAGKKGYYAALVKHAGRHSGCFYHTPVMAACCKNGFVFPLVYGDEADWYQNILAAEGCILVYQGKEYSLVNPRLVSTDNGLNCYKSFERFLLKMFNIDHFFEMDRVN